MNITDGIWRQSHAWPERAAVIYDGRPMSYLHLRNNANLTAVRLFKLGVGRGDAVAVRARSPLVYLLLVLALARMGASITAFRKRDTPAFKETLLKRHGVRWLVHDHDDTWRSASLPGAHVDVDELFAPPGGEPWKLPPVAHDADDLPWLIATSSGTTGIPKSMLHRQARSMLNFSLGRPLWHSQPQTVMFFGDLTISMGMGQVLRALLSGSTLVCTASADSAYFFEMIERDRPTRVATTTGLATKVAAYAAQQLPGSLAMCSSVQVITVAGASVSPAVREAIRSRICPQLEINYGAAESGQVASANSETLAVHPESAGMIHPWVVAEVVDDDDQPLPPGTVGALRFKTPTLISGYLDDAAASARAFRNGWYYPGDTGALNAAGYLFLAGRTDHLLNLGGRKLDPVLIENALNEHPAVLESAVVPFRSSQVTVPVLVGVVVLQAPVEMDALRAYCSERLGPAMTPRRIVAIEALPKNEGGKLIREQVTATLQRRLVAAQGN